MYAKDQYPEVQPGCCEYGFWVQPGGLLLVFHNASSLREVNPCILCVCVSVSTKIRDGLERVSARCPQAVITLKVEPISYPESDQSLHQKNSTNVNTTAFSVVLISQSVNRYP